MEESDIQIEIARELDRSHPAIYSNIRQKVLHNNRARLVVDQLRKAQEAVASASILRRPPPAPPHREVNDVFRTPPKDPSRVNNESWFDTTFGKIFGGKSKRDL